MKEKQRELEFSEVQSVKATQIGSKHETVQYSRPKQTHKTEHISNDIPGILCSLVGRQNPLKPPQLNSCTTLGAVALRTLAYELRRLAAVS